jgi:hypothetical protein
VTTLQHCQRQLKQAQQEAASAAQQLVRVRGAALGALAAHVTRAQRQQQVVVMRLALWQWRHAAASSQVRQPPWWGLRGTFCWVTGTCLAKMSLSPVAPLLISTLDGEYTLPSLPNPNAHSCAKHCLIPRLLALAVCCMPHRPASWHRSCWTPRAAWPPAGSATWGAAPPP